MMTESHLQMDVTVSTFGLGKKSDSLSWCSLDFLTNLATFFNIIIIIIIM